MLGYVPPVSRLQPIAWAETGVVVRGMFGPGRQLDGSMPAGTAITPRAHRRGIIIDLDDTLYPRERFVRSGLAAVARHVGLAHGIAADAAYGTMVRALSSGRGGFELQALCRRFDLPAEVIPTLIDVFRMHTPTIFLSEEATTALQRLRADGWAIAVLTNGLSAVQFRKVAALGLTTLVDEIVYAEEHAPGGKPSPAPFHAALRALELPAARCVCAGDDMNKDIRGARQLGIATVRVARPGIPAPEGDEADVVIDSLQQLPGAAALLRPMVAADVA